LEKSVLEEIDYELLDQVRSMYPEFSIFPKGEGMTEFAILKPEPRFDVKIWTLSKGGYNWEIEIKDAKTQAEADELYQAAMLIVQRDHQALIQEEAAAEETDVGF